jgi:hypothetical protein
MRARSLAQTPDATVNCVGTHRRTARPHFGIARLLAIAQEFSLAHRADQEQLAAQITAYDTLFASCDEQGGAISDNAAVAPRARRAA